LPPSLGSRQSASFERDPLSQLDEELSLPVEALSLLCADRFDDVPRLEANTTNKPRKTAMRLIQMTMGGLNGGQ
jgi:hypothetical protein